MTPGEIVETFTYLTGRCLDALKEEYESLERGTVYTGLMLLPRGGGSPTRSGSLHGLGDFKLHGYGCQFELYSGEDLDLDWDAQGRAIFDSWRILMFARSIGDNLIDRETLRVAATKNSSVVQLSDDLFTWPNGKYDLELSD